MDTITPRYPAGTREHDAYVADLRAALADWVAAPPADDTTGTSRRIARALGLDADDVAAVQGHLHATIA